MYYICINIVTLQNSYYNIRSKVKTVEYIIYFLTTVWIVY